MGSSNVPETNGASQLGTPPRNEAVRDLTTRAARTSLVHRVSWRSTWVAMLVGLIAVGGCASRTHSPMVGRSSATSGKVLTVADTRVGPPLMPRVLDLSVRRTRHTTFLLEATSVTDNGHPERQLRARFYETTATQPRPLVVVLPIWGSSPYPPAKIVGWLTRPEHAVRANVLWLEGPDRLIDWQAGAQAETPAELEAAVAGWVDAVQGTVVDVRRLIDWAQARPSVAGDRVGIVGFSISAIVSSLVLAEEPSIASAVLLEGGAHLHEILTSCRGPAAGFRRAIVGRFGWDRSTLAGWLAPRLLAINPVEHEPLLDPSRILVIEAKRDRCIPKVAREDFWQNLGRPERISLDYGHKISFLAMTPLGFHYSTKQTISFLDRTLLGSDARPADRPRSFDSSVATAAAGPDSGQ